MEEVTNNAKKHNVTRTELPACGQLEESNEPTI